MWWRTQNRSSRSNLEYSSLELGYNFFFLFCFYSFYFWSLKFFILLSILFVLHPLCSFLEIIILMRTKCICHHLLDRISILSVFFQNVSTSASGLSSNPPIRLNFKFRLSFLNFLGKSIDKVFIWNLFSFQINLLI